MTVSEISGVITKHLAALGTGTRDRRVFAILTRNPQFVEDEPVLDAAGVQWVDMANTVDGLRLRFRDGELDSVRTTIRRVDAEMGGVGLDAPGDSGARVDGVLSDGAAGVDGGLVGLPARPGADGAPGEDSAQYYPFPEPAALISGLDLSAATRADLVATLGPAEEGPNADAEPVDGAAQLTFALDGALLVADFLGDVLMSISVRRR